MLPPEVVVIGNAGVDTNVYLPGQDVDWSREANFTENLDYVGQAGGYASRGYARLGWRTAFIGHVGADAAGRMVREAFDTDGIDTRGLFFDPAGTARSVNLMYRDGRRKNFYDGKGHESLKVDPAAVRAVLEGSKLAHVNLADWARHLLPLAQSLGVKVACDLQDVVDPEDPYRRDFIHHADILFFSAANHGDPAPLMQHFLRARPGCIVVAGMGARGCMLGTGDGSRHFPPVDLDLPVVDTNGAGDGLAVGFLTSYVLEGRPLNDAILRGQVTARHTCAQRASSSNLISRKELDECVRGLQA
ncbi:MAG: carbohydrate kinase family protein [Holophagaceae bacterium]|nr:carbohydrate kinase family protein [Holophagaceae bacterium]